MPETHDKSPTRAGRHVIGEQIKVRFSAEMKAELQALADRYGMSLSEYLRALALADLRKQRGERD